MSEKKDPMIRFMAKVKIPSDPNQCWEWTASKRESCLPGFKAGQFTFKGKNALSHRAAYELFFGVTPTKHVLHHCDNHECVNPAHLYEGTASQNMQDSVRRGRNFMAKKTHCKRGHAFDEKNTRHLGHGRLCKKCQLTYIKPLKTKKGISQYQNPAVTKPNQSGYRGVYWSGRNWFIEVYNKGEKIRRDGFRDAKKAAIYRDELVIKLGITTTVLNFPELSKVVKNTKAIA